VGVATALLPPTLARARPVEDPLIEDPVSEDDEDEDSEEDVVLPPTTLNMT
jgi:hypothetical protein